MAKVFDYRLYQSDDADGNPILADVTAEYNETNLQIAKKEAYNGEVSDPYDDGQPEPEAPSGDDSAVWDELDAAYQAGYDEGYTEGVNSAYDQ